MEKAKKTELLKFLDEEETRIEERLTALPLPFDPMKKVVAVMSRKPKMYEFSKIHKGSLSDRLIAYNLIEHLSAERINNYLEMGNKNGLAIPKLILGDVALEFTQSYYDPSKTLDVLAIEAARDIYHDLFCVLAEPVYVHGKKKEVKKKAIAEKKEDYQEEYGMFAPQNIEALITACETGALFKDIEQRLPYVTEVSELKQLIAVNMYKMLIKNKQLIAPIAESVLDLRYSTKDIFVYTILRLHQDFFMEMDDGREK